jgi:clan AA aspartic protease
MEKNGEKPMGRIVVDLTLANNQDVQMAKGNALPADQVRHATIQAVVDCGANQLVLPLAVVQQLGLPSVGQASVRYADDRTELREVVEQVEVELQGRRGTFQALVEPKRTTALVGAIVLETLDFLADCGNQRIYPRDPIRIIAEVE